MARALGPLAHGLTTIRVARVGYGAPEVTIHVDVRSRACRWAPSRQLEETETEEGETSVDRRYLGGFSNETALGSIDIGRLVKGFLPAPGRSGSRSTATSAPLFQRGWPPSWIRKKSRNARSGWSGQPDRFPIATASAAGRGSSRQPKSLHDRSLARTLSHFTAKLAAESVALKIKARTHLFNNCKANTYGG